MNGCIGKPANSTRIRINRIRWLLLLAIGLFSSCRAADESSKPVRTNASGCEEMAVADSASIEESLKCSQARRDSIEKIHWRIRDSTRHAAFFAPDTSNRAELIIDYSYEEGVTTLIVWKNGKIGSYDGRFPADVSTMDIATMALAAKTSDSLRKLGGRRCTGEAWKSFNHPNWRTFVNKNSLFYEDTLSECLSESKETCRPLVKMIMDLFWPQNRSRT